MYPQDHYEIADAIMADRRREWAANRLAAAARGPRLGLGDRLRVAFTGRLEGIELPGEAFAPRPERA